MCIRDRFYLVHIKIPNNFTLELVRFVRPLADKIIKVYNIYSAVMRRFTAQGGVKNWDTSTPSVWLTAWALRTFSSVWYQDWEDYIYIDPLVCNTMYTP